MKKKESLSYPIVFSTTPIERIWGGNFIKELLANNTCNLVVSKDKIYGELWLLSDRKDVQSIVQNGSLKGVTINQLWNKYREQLFGVTNKEKSRFPLLIKIIDAAEDLSLQVHPTEQYASRFNNAEPKTEMWYIIKGSSNAKILAGFKEKSKIDKQKFINLINNTKELKNVVNEFASTDNSYFFIPSGTIHSIGKNNLVFEIQQNSDTTYRVSDWGRVDKNGKSRDLHIKESIDCINFTDSHIINNKIAGNNAVYEKEITPKNQYFKMLFYKINSYSILDTKNSYKLLTVISGDLKVSFKNSSNIVSKFTTILLPIENKYDLEPVTKEVSFLCYYS